MRTSRRLERATTRRHTTTRFAARRPEEYLTLGDRLLRRGDARTAATCYARCADAWMAETFLGKARELVASQPVQALKALAQVERLVGPTGEARRLTARAYESLGQPEIARSFLLAVQ